MSSPPYKKFPYRVTYPDSSEAPSNRKTLEDALHTSSWSINRVWNETGPWGRAGEPTNDANTAVIVNRNTGYRWIMRRGRPEVEFQTPAMTEDIARAEGIDIYLTVEEAEALLDIIKGSESPDARQVALSNQALDQIAQVCREVRTRVEMGERQVDRRFSSIPRTRPALSLQDSEENRD